MFSTRMPKTADEAIDGSTDVFCDNKSVATNASFPSSILNKKRNSICYHRVREAQAAGTMRVCWVEGECNEKKLATKTALIKSLYQNKKLINYVL